MYFKPNVITACDFYKIGHPDMYHPKMSLLVSNLTCRNDKYADMLKASPYYQNETVVFGIQLFVCDFLIKGFNEGFFNQPKDKVVAKFKQRVDSSLGTDIINITNIEKLHDLGYLPIELKAIDEGAVVNLNIPLVVINNTHPDFAWLVNYLESCALTSLWKPITIATVSYEYKKILSYYAKETSDNEWLVDFCGHDFSLRGQDGIEDAMVSGAAFLTSFKGTDSIPALDLLEEYYGVDSAIEAAGFSVRASEHSIMTSLILYEQSQLIKQGLNGDTLSEAEYIVFKNLLEKFPNGILSLVSDQFDYWSVISKHLPRLKDIIMARNGKLVVRPDSSDPVEVACGASHKVIKDKCYRITQSMLGADVTLGEISKEEAKGTIESLWDIFGGTINSKGYKELDSHIGMIQGDALTIPRVLSICEGLKEKGFATTNMVFGIGAYSLNGMLTRDTFGQAFKATYCEIDGTPVNVYKQPKTDSSKNSAKGLLRVEKIDNNYIVHQEQTWGEYQMGELTTVFKDGVLIKQTTLAEIRQKLS
jgi:nicotinamide phosphoribosyltransferase